MPLRPIEQRLGLLRVIIVILFMATGSAAEATVATSFCAHVSRALGSFRPITPEQPLRKTAIVDLQSTPNESGRAIQAQSFDAVGMMSDDEEFVLGFDLMAFNHALQTGRLGEIAKYLSSINITSSLSNDYFRFLAQQPVDWEKLVDAVFERFDTTTGDSMFARLTLQDLETIFERALRASPPRSIIVQMNDSWLTRAQKRAKRVQYYFEKARWTILFERSRKYLEILELNRSLTLRLQSRSPEALLPSTSSSPERR